MRWAIEIQATQLDRRNLADLLSHLGLLLVDESPHLVFTSDEIDECLTAAEVYEIAKKVKHAFAGAAADIDTSFALGSVVDYSQTPAKRCGFSAVEETIHLHDSSSAMVSPGPGLSEEDLRDWHERQAEAVYQLKLDTQLSRLVPAYFNPKAAKVLELLAIDEQTGATLYKIYELMRGPGSNGSAFGQQFGISDHEYRRFAEVVHLDSVSGDWARHAHGEPSKTGSPMTKEEAESFVRALAQRWLNHVRATHAG